MKKFFLLSLILCGVNSVLNAQDLTVFKSNMTVQETVSKIETLVADRNLMFFETVAHDVIAHDRGFEMDSVDIILFEDPILSSELIICEKTAALDLPLKIMVWAEDDEVFIGYSNPQLMKRRFLIQGCSETLAKMTSLMVRIVNEALRTN